MAGRVSAMPATMEPSPRRAELLGARIEALGVSAPALAAPAARVRARAAVVVAFFVHGAILASWASRIPSVKDALDLGAGALGVALLGQALGALLAAPLAGAACARVGSRSV